MAKKTSEKFDNNHSRTDSERQKKRTQHFNRFAGYDSELHWFLTASARALGESSNLGAFINAALSGGSHGVPSTDLYSDEQVGIYVDDALGRRRVPGDIDRARVCAIAWDKLDERTQYTLLARYACEIEKLFPPGFIAAFGDLALLAWFEASRAGCLAEVNANDETAKAYKWPVWKETATAASLVAHRLWATAWGAATVEAA